MRFEVMRHAAIGMLLIAPIGRPLWSQEPAPLPAGVPDKAIESGRTLFHGIGQCSGCHGEEGAGTPEAPSLVEGPWKLGDGDYTWLVHMAGHAGWGARTRGGEPRPMRGPGVLDSTQVREVAAYVWSISRKKSPRPPKRETDR